MKRRELLGRLAAAAAAPAVRPSRLGQAANAGPALLDARATAFLAALAEVVLPSELGVEGRARIVDDFARWVRNYSEGAEMDHGYGFTSLRSTGPSPARRYPELMTQLDRQVSMRLAGASFTSAPVSLRRTVVEEALREVKTERLSARPGGNLIVDLMSFYFHSSAANDLCYRAAIGRDDCRGLAGSEDPP